MKTGRFASVAFLLAVALCSTNAVRAEESHQTDFNLTYEAAANKARQDCTTLWSNHAFDSIRDKIPLNGEKPTFSMLKNTEKLPPKDKPIADLAIKTLDQCRKAYEPVYLMLPPQVLNMIRGVERLQDAAIAELYRGKVSFGEFNVAMNRMTGQLATALSGLSKQPETSAVEGANRKETSAPTDRNAATLLSETRLALVIGNSQYANLPKLSNPSNDARAVADSLKKMGYRTRLLIDATEQGLRKEVRQFASDSENASVALVFYAGHGAQVNGSNFVIPVDIDIPRTETDIQFSGLKVDDVVNSIQSNTKIVFLDACRDNPVLFKNIVKGRGAAPTGLAPATGSNLDQKPGGGVFIAYATDAGAVADDGNGSHSPFTAALLRNLSKPISIDDMFSLVTKEVRLVTKNMQHPYKYASLENIICIAPSCSNKPPPLGDIVEQARRSESDEFNIALQTNTLAALETFLEKYPDTTTKAEVQNSIDTLKRAQLTEWTLFAVGDHLIPWYVQLSSIQQIGDRVAAKILYEIDSSKPKKYLGKDLPEAYYEQDISVYDCKNRMNGTSEETILDKSKNVLFHYKFGDPQYIATNSTIAPGSVGFAAVNIFCDASLRTPGVSKDRLTKMNFKSLSSTVAGDGNLFYEPLPYASSDKNEKLFLFIFNLFEDHQVPLNPGTSIVDPPTYRTQIDRVKLLCTEKKMRVLKNEYYDASNKMTYLMAVDPAAQEANWIEIKTELSSPLSMLHRIFCSSGEASK